MNWELLIEVLMDNVKDNDVREAIYKGILEECDYTDTDVVEEAVGIDPVFDAEASLFLEEHQDEDDEDDDEEEEEDEY